MKTGTHMFDQSQGFEHRRSRNRARCVRWWCTGEQSRSRGSTACMAETVRCAVLSLALQFVYRCRLLHAPGSRLSFRSEQIWIDCRRDQCSAPPSG
jgi:hypothetical protein